MCPGQHQNQGRGWRRETGLSPPVKYFKGGTSFEDLLFFFLVFVMPLCAPVYLCLLVTCWESAGLLALVCSVSLSHWYPGSDVVLDCIDS